MIPIIRGIYFSTFSFVLKLEVSATSDLSAADNKTTATMRDSGCWGLDGAEIITDFILSRVLRGAEDCPPSLFWVY